MSRNEHVKFHLQSCQVFLNTREVILWSAWPLQGLQNDLLQTLLGQAEELESKLFRQASGLASQKDTKGGWIRGQGGKYLMATLGEKKTEEEKQWAAQYHWCQGLSTAESTCSWGGLGRSQNWLPREAHGCGAEVTWGSKGNSGPTHMVRPAWSRPRIPEPHTSFLSLATNESCRHTFRETSWRSSWNLTPLTNVSLHFWKVHWKKK